MVDAQTGTIDTIAGGWLPGFSGDGGPSIIADLNMPRCVAIYNDNELYICDTKQQARAPRPLPLLFPLPLAPPAGVRRRRRRDTSAAPAATTFRIRQVNLDSGSIVSVVGSNTAGFSGGGGPASSASLQQPYKVSLDGAGHMFIVDNGNNT